MISTFADSTLGALAAGAAPAALDEPDAPEAAELPDCPPPELLAPALAADGVTALACSLCAGLFWYHHAAPDAAAIPRMATKGYNFLEVMRLSRENYCLLLIV